jgi:hypothetical protein
LLRSTAATSFFVSYGQISSFMPPKFCLLVIRSWIRAPLLFLTPLFVFWSTQEPVFFLIGLLGPVLTCTFLGRCSSGISSLLSFASVFHRSQSPVRVQGAPVSFRRLFVTRSVLCCWISTGCVLPCLICQDRYRSWFFLLKCFVVFVCCPVRGLLVTVFSFTIPVCWFWVSLQVITCADFEFIRLCVNCCRWERVLILSLLDCVWIIVGENWSCFWAVGSNNWVFQILVILLWWVLSHVYHVFGEICVRL